MQEIELDDSQNEFVLPIAGLEFQRNTYFKSNNSRGISKLASSIGPLVSDFVTHQSNFKYDTYGIHIGQDDRLTFFGCPQQIIGHFIDCREKSETFGKKVALKYNASPERRIVIPRGVAHSFDNLQNIVTRDEPVWYSDFHNPDWDMNSDLISIPRDISFADLPKVRPNSYRLPDQAHHLFSRIQQELLKDARRYGKRERLESNSQQYQISENSNWHDEVSDYQKWLLLSFDIPDMSFRRNHYALTFLAPENAECGNRVLRFAQ